jgi:hypothetical protein
MTLHQLLHYRRDLHPTPLLPDNPEDIVRRMADALYASRIDPSDEPETIFLLLYSLNIYHWTVISENFESILYEVGQRYIADEMSRQETA